jgi:CxxC motif-containing protein (DUF1111 family)
MLDSRWPIIHAVAALFIIGATAIIVAGVIPGRHILDTSSVKSAYSLTEEKLGGGTTIPFSRYEKESFGRSAMNISREHWTNFFYSKIPFVRDWTRVAGTSPVGPTFNATSCSSCHFRDGRGRPPEGAEAFPISMVFRIGAADSSGQWGPDPVYGGQIRTHAVDGLPAPGNVRINYQSVHGIFEDGTEYELRKPECRLVNLSHGEPKRHLSISARVAPATFGLGLLEAVPDAEIMRRADPMDRDGDGISGCARVLRDVETGSHALGRFGWKAGQPTIRQQAARAFSEDMGITSPLFGGQEYTRGDHPGAVRSPEISREQLDSVVFYLKLIGVPGRRDWNNSNVRRGKALFNFIGCARCHVEELHTGNVDHLPELSNQIIHPYTDILLHDMGPGLADPLPEGSIDGTEWRTAPLWGIGLVHVVSEHTNFLHDGRARNIEEAILWHGGEAESAQSQYCRLSANDRSALLEFLNSL